MTLSDLIMGEIRRLPSEPIGYEWNEFVCHVISSPKVAAPRAVPVHCTLSDHSMGTQASKRGR
jgi:hypothetical protein